MKLNFSKSPVSQEAITAALEERRAKIEAARALAYAQDVERCQHVVDTCGAHLKALRKAEKIFATAFKKLEGIESAQEFAKIVSETPELRSIVGYVHLTAEYDEE